MAANYILGCLAVLFLSLAGLRSMKQRRLDPAARTWLIIGTVFAAVSLWSWLSRAS